MAPKEAKIRSMLLFGIFYSAGVELLTLWYWVALLSSETRLFKFDVIRYSYIVTLCLALAQFLLSVAKYKKDTPKYLCEISKDDDALEELK